MSNRGSAAARSGAAPALWLGGRAGRGRRASNGPCSLGLEHKISDFHEAAGSP